MSDLLFFRYVEHVLSGPNHFLKAPLCAQNRPVLFEGRRFKVAKGLHTTVERSFLANSCDLIRVASR